MGKFKTAKKGVALLIVIATLLVVAILASVVLTVISSQSRLTHHQVSRIKAYYAAKGIMNYAQEQLRTGAWTRDTGGGSNRYACHSEDGTCIGGVTKTWDIPYDSDIKYKVRVTIYPDPSTRLDIKTDYTYTP